MQGTVPAVLCHMYIKLIATEPMHLCICIHTDVLCIYVSDYSCVLLCRGVAVLFIRAHSAVIGMLKGGGGRGGEGRRGVGVTIRSYLSSATMPVV